jgi:universal stress protein F
MYKRIIVAIDLGNLEQAKTLFSNAVALLDTGGDLRLVHVLEAIPGYIAAELPDDLVERRNAEARAEMNVLASKIGAPVHTEVRHGAPASQIIESAESSGADLIMIASHRPGLSDYFIGSTAARVVRHAKCSVLIVR